MTNNNTRNIDRFIEEQIFEEDVRSVLSFFRPNRRERLEGWSEYRTGGADFRVTVSWAPGSESPGEMEVWRLPRMADVLEALLIGSVQNQDELTPAEEFAHYRGIAEELRRRVDELEMCYR